MRLRDEIKLATVPIYVVLVAFVFGATGLLARMAPALDEVLSENVASVQASVDMLAALGHHDAANHDARADFRSAFERARANVTVDGEIELIRRIESHMDAALAGDAVERAATIDALLELERLNVSSMHRASDAARRLGSAGTAAVVMLASIAIIVGIRSRRRLYRSIVNAVVELNATMRQAMEDQNSMRRVSATECATELAFVADGVNRLLDERARRRGDEVGLSTIEKAALNRLLDRQAAPTMLVSRSGELLAASQDVLASAQPHHVAEVIDAIRVAHEKRIPTPSFPAWISTEAIGEVGWLLGFTDETRLRAAGEPPNVGGSSNASAGPEADAPASARGRPASIPHTLGHGPLSDDDHDDHEHTGVTVRPGSSLFPR